MPAAAGDAAAITNIWTGQGAPTPINAGSATSVNAGATVAMGMHPQNGYIYAIRATQGDTDFSQATSRDYTGHIQVLKYGTTGVDNLGVIQGMPANRWFQWGPNVNAAAFNPANNELIIGNLRGGPVNELIRISVANDVPTYVGTITLSQAITAQSGDFAIDATGTYAYGIATAARGSSNTSYQVDLATGTVTLLQTGVGETFFGSWAPYGGAARLQNGQMAFVGGFSTATPGVRLMSIPAGTVSDEYTQTQTAQSTDAAECLPKLTATLQCTPTDLVDAAGNVSTCTVTLDGPAPAGGLPVDLTLPTTNPRYSTTCASPITIAAGATEAQCTITATPNTVPGDGNVAATIALATPPATADYELGTPTEATVTVKDDDNTGPGPIAPIPATGIWSLLAMGLGLTGLAWRRQRRQG